MFDNGYPPEMVEGAQARLPSLLKIATAFAEARAEDARLANETGNRFKIIANMLNALEDQYLFFLGSALRVAGEMEAGDKEVTGEQVIADIRTYLSHRRE